MAMYDWLASNSAPAGCPMEINVGGFLLSGGGELYIPAKILHAGWGTPVSVHGVGEKLKPLPERVTITFYSYFEDKFYSGTFDLPRERIEKLFATGYRTRRDKSGRATFIRIIAGVAPGGTVAVWVSGIGRRVEVFFGRAHEEDLDWHEVMRLREQHDRKSIVEEIIADAARHDPLVLQRRQHLDLNVWSSYRPRYDLRPQFDGLEVPTSIELHYFNGEQEDLFLPQDEASKVELRAAPRFINISFTSLGKQVDYTFDEEETLSTFRRLGANGAPLEMIFKREIQNGTPMYGVFLRNGHETVELNKIKIEAFDL